MSTKQLELRKAAASLGAVASHALRDLAAAGAADDLRHAADSPCAADLWIEDPTGDPILVEGFLELTTVRVDLPDAPGTLFRFRGSYAGGIAVLVHIHPAAGRFATVFRLSAEGVHAYLGRAERITEGGAA